MATRPAVKNHSPPSSARRNLACNDAHASSSLPSTLPRFIIGPLSPPNKILLRHGKIRRMQSSLLRVHYNDFSDTMIDENNNNSDDDDWSTNIPTAFPWLRNTLSNPPIRYSSTISSNIISQLFTAGFVDDNDLVQFAKGFVKREEVLSDILIRDFGWKDRPLDAHRARVGLIALAREELHLSLSNDDNNDVNWNELQQSSPIDHNHNHDNNRNNDQNDQKEVEVTASPNSPKSESPSLPGVSNSLPNKTLEGSIKTMSLREESTEEGDETIKPLAPWKSVLVNDKAKLRRRSKTDRNTKTNGSGIHSDSKDEAKKDSSYNYGLLPLTSNNDDRQTYRTLYAELDNFLSYMTIPHASGTQSSDPPIREQTAKVYINHARLFLGWIVDARSVLTESSEELIDAPRESEQRDMDDGKDGQDKEPFTMSSPLAASSSSALSGTMASQPDEADSVRKRVWANVLRRMRPSSMRESNEGNNDDARNALSLYDIFPSSTADSASCVVRYILWLRSERRISSNYEANILRGMIKLVKFRFSYETSSLSDDPSAIQITGTSSSKSSTRLSSSTTTPLDNLPIVTELRKLHREAGLKGKKAPRSSDEQKKWLEWEEYLEVIRLLKMDLSDMIDSYNEKMLVLEEMQGDEMMDLEDGLRTGEVGHEKSGKTGGKAKSSSGAIAKSLRVQRKDIATTFQQYLVLSFFACVPDRQRTLRELELGRNFLRVPDDEGSNTSNNGGKDGNGVDGAVWVIKHTAEDYKTGGTYGERPPLPLLVSLTPDIDDFLERWRPTLFRTPSKDFTAVGTIDDDDHPSFFFLQPRTGNPLTANSVYQIVSRCCYKYKQKKTNPHLLRDMIVTHVRKNADASEKELEALALFMGHSLQMQRDSYDRRTLEQKVSPAVKLMQNMNMNSLGGD